jgi:tRNA threonylcarbamoyladenosine biosynthesis protein TsaB
LIPARSKVTIKLRSYTSEDFEDLYEIDQRCYEPAIAYSRRELRNYLRFPGADCIVAEDGRAMVGFCLTAHKDSWGYIVTMDVLEAYRRRGVGSLLLAEAERRLANDGVCEVGLETAVDNAAGIGFWRRHGYRAQGIRKGYYPSGRDAYSMIKGLSSKS